MPPQVSVGIAPDISADILEALCRSTAWTEPAEFWLKLHLWNPGTAGTNAPAANTTRKQPTFSPASGGAITNSADIVWAAVPATETYKFLSVWDASSGGTYLATIELSAYASITAGQTYTIASGNLDLTLPVAS